MPRTCVVYGCRSVYHPTKAEKEKLQDKFAGTANRSISVHAFLVKNKELVQKWKESLSFMDIRHKNNFFSIGVCRLHFLESNNYKDITTIKTGTERKLRILKKCSVPSIFPTVPKLLQKSTAAPHDTQRSRTSVRQDLFRTEALKLEKDIMQQMRVKDYNDLITKINCCNILTEFV